jgi:glycosyltransferase involved in cell wall biosynthesis
MSKWEGMPNVVLEGMAAGCPLILSDIQEHSDLLGNDAALYVDSDDHLMLAKTLQIVLIHRVDSKYRIENAFTIVSEFNIDSISKSYEFIYKQISNKKCVE